MTLQQQACHRQSTAAAAAAVLSFAGVCLFVRHKQLFLLFVVFVVCVAEAACSKLRCSLLASAPG